MKTMIAALALVLLASGPTFAASAHRGFYVPQHGYSYIPQSTYDAWSGIAGGTNYSTTSREGLVHAF
jgi:hypothetical protein